MDLLLITQMVIAATAVISCCLSLRNGFKIQKVHFDINGRMNELLKSETSLSRAEGYMKGSNGGMPAGYLKLKKKMGTVSAAKIWNKSHKGTGKTVGKGRK